MSRYRAAMVGLCKSLQELSTKGADLVVICNACGHDRTIAIERATRLFFVRGWSADWDRAHRRFRCRKCGSKDVRLDADFYGYALRHQRQAPTLVAVAETLRPGLRPPPPGVALADWNRATEAERKKMVDRARS